jgi:hypothetical protein
MRHGVSYGCRNLGTGRVEGHNPLDIWLVVVIMRRVSGTYRRYHGIGLVMDRNLLNINSVMSIIHNTILSHTVAETR